MRATLRAGLCGFCGITLLASGGCVTSSGLHEPQFLATVQHKVTDLFDNPNPCSNNDSDIGVVTGAVVGAFIGHRVEKNDKGMLVGAAVGATVGGLIGHSIDARRCALYRIAEKDHLKLASATITPAKLGIPGKHTLGLDVQIQDQDVIFEPRSAHLVPGARGYLEQIAAQYTPHMLVAALGANPPPQALAAAERRKVLIVAHAAQAADPLWAERLSEARARVVAELFAARGVPGHDIYYQGAGDALPVGNNATARGRQENRRVQIVDVASRAQLARYLGLRTANPADFTGVTYRPAAPSAPGAAANAAASDEPAPPSPNASFLQRMAARAKRLAWRVAHPTETPAPAAAVAAAPPPPAVPASRLPAGAYDFGGSPLRGMPAPIDLGTIESHSMFSFIRGAHAGDVPVRIGACTTDRPHLASAVRNLSSGRVLPVRDDLPGFYGAPWLSEPHGNLVAILDAYVPKSSGLPVPDPRLDIYRDYARFHERQPTYSRLEPVNVYRGRRGTLYRVFVGGPMRCMDLFVPARAGEGKARIYYPRIGQSYLATATFAVRQ
jgi:outer membrane protein OmpA-like peptidoglycan-associated protein